MAFILLWGGGGNYNVHYCNEIGSFSERAISNWAKTQRYNCWSSRWNRTRMRWGDLMMSFIPADIPPYLYVSAQPQLSEPYICILCMLQVKQFQNPTGVCHVLHGFRTDVHHSTKSDSSAVMVSSTSQSSAHMHVTMWILVLYYDVKNVNMFLRFLIISCFQVEHWVKIHIQSTGLVLKWWKPWLHIVFSHQWLGKQHNLWN